MAKNCLECVVIFAKDWQRFSDWWNLLLVPLRPFFQLGKAYCHGRFIGTVMKEENFMAALAGVAERINRNEIDNLLEMDWNRITDGFRECCLKMLLTGYRSV